MSLWSTEPSDLLVSHLVLVFESCVVLAAPLCPCRGSSSAEPVMNSGLLGGLEVGHSPESWAGHDSPHNKDDRYEPESVLGQSL